MKAALAAFKDKLNESISSILPIAIIIMILAIILGIDTYTFVLLAIGCVLLVVGLSGFNMGADMSMLVIGEKIGSVVTHSRKIWLIALVSFVIGIIVTIAEPDLNILAGYVEGAISNKWILILTVALGVGIFLTIAMLRIVLKIRLSILLIIFYVLAFVLAFGFVDESFWAIAFDSGGVTTGPMTVPFIMSLGVGVASIRSDKEGKDDSFGLVALASIGPIIAVLVLGVIIAPASWLGVSQSFTYPYEGVSTITSGTVTNTVYDFVVGLGQYAEEVAIALAPIVAFFLLFQLVTRSFHKRQLVRIIVGIIITFVGLTLFLTGANIGFEPMGTKIGEELADSFGGWFLIPVGMIIGYFMIAAEPSVHVLNKQVERMSAGAIKARSMKLVLGVSVSVALGLAMLRVITQINIMWILVPGYIIALVLTFFCPKLFTGIAFDSGGVASGAMVSAFVLPMAIGACGIISSETVAVSIMTDAFGCVAFVALMPLIVIQIFGILHKRKATKIKKTVLSVDDRIIEYEVG